MAERTKRIREEITGVLSVLGSIYLGLSLYTYSKWDTSFLSFTQAPTSNYGGVFGAYCANLLITIIGVASFSMPLFLLVYGIRRVLGRPGHKVYLFGAGLFILSSALLLSLLLSTFRITADINGGGLFGLYVAGFMKRYFSRVGAFVFSLSGFFSSIILLSPGSLTSFALDRMPSKTKDRQKKPEKGVVEEEILIREPEKAGPAPELVERPLPEPEADTREPEPARMQRPRKPAGGEGYQLPSVEFLTIYDTSMIRPQKEELLSNSALLEGKLADFGVEGKITHVHPGPVVTMYEFEPAPGVKINKVVSLSDDLTLGLKAQNIRVSPIPGKATIGIEVPNRQREVVSLREIVTSENFTKGHSKLTLALGKDIFGNPIVADLAKMPHLLVAGATGAGKSVSINSMVMSLLYKARPSEVKMLMIDPKLLELSMYEEIPHLISPVITNPKKAAEALRKMVFEMERRYRLLAEKGSRNIDSFNLQASDEDRLPYIVVFIDELADLMFASSNEVEDSITRLAQMARAAGIHLIIATQRPSVDVITGLIKANFPARISFQVFSKIDSRTILDTQGAEQLLGKGDMLMMLPGSRIIRVHGAFITEDEITSVTAFIKEQGRPDFSIFEEIPVEAPPSEEEDSAEKDEMFDKAAEFADAAGEVSISSLQRRFKIGYNRAARIMEIMEEEGMVGPPKGAGKPRDFIRRH
jgi:S-DNA-T family DNA segregation ATPase FtsK/SpoIIIE